MVAVEESVPSQEDYKPAIQEAAQTDMDCFAPRRGKHLCASQFGSSDDPDAASTGLKPCKSERTCTPNFVFDCCGVTRAAKQRVGRSTNREVACQFLNPLVEDSFHYPVIFPG